MFIIICQDVIEKAIDCNDRDNENAVEVLKKTLLAVQWRKHIVFVPELTEEDIQKLKKELTPKEIKLLEYVFSRRLNSNSLMAKLSIYVQITFNKSTHKDSPIIYINPKTTFNFELYEETHLIVENILDSVFYDKAICNYYQRKNKLNSCYTTEFYPVQGGGMAIPEVIKYEIGLAQHFCFIIGDSDKKCSKSKEGQTASEIREMLKKNKSSYMDFYIMSKVREIENLIPFCILNLYSMKKQEDFLAQHANTNNLSFFDMKLGMDYKILYYARIHEEYKSIFPTEIDWNKIDDIKRNVDCPKRFSEEVSSIPSFIKEWGTGILYDVLYPQKPKQKDNIYKLYEIKESDLTPNQKEEWDAIGKLIFSWCCCFAHPPR